MYRVVSKVIDCAEAFIDQISQDWLANAVALDNQSQNQYRYLLGLAFALPVASLFVLLPQLSILSSIATALVVSATSMFAIGWTALTGRTNLPMAILIAAGCAVTIFSSISEIGASSLYLALLVILPIEFKLVGQTKSSFTTGITIAGSCVVLALGLQYAGVPEIISKSESPLAVLSSCMLVLGFYSLYRGGVLKNEPEQVENESQVVEQSIAEPKQGRSDVFEFMDGLITHHASNGEVVDVSGTKRDLICSRPANLLGNGFLNLIYVSDRISYLSAIDQLRQGNNTANATLRFETNGQSEVQFKFIQANFMAIRDNLGGLDGFYIQSQDVSEYKMALNQIEELAERTLDNETSKTRFLAGVSHELRTPLNSIMGFSDVLLHEVIAPFTDQRQREYVGLIRDSGEHLLNVVNTMLDMSKIQNGHYNLHAQDFEFAPLLDSTIEMLDIQAKKQGVKITSRIAKGLPEVNADNRALKQIIINLVGNAIKFTKQGGVVSIDSEIRGNDFVMCVSDTGIGIPEDKLSKIGQPFMQVDSSLAREYEGTGLGLSLVKGLVELHKGEFSIESKLGEGTQVTIRIPQTGSCVADIEANRSQEAQQNEALKGAVYGGDKINVA